MKHFTFKWLKRFYILIAIKLVLLAVLLTSARILFISVEDYKEQAIEWLVAEYQIDISVENISAGIDFSGMVLTLNNVSLLDANELPFSLTLEHLFLHINFRESVTARQLVFNSISLQNVDLTLKKQQQTATSKKSQISINTLKNIFLNQLKKFSVKDSQINFTDQLGQPKTVVIETLRWLNEGERHQGIGKATLPDALRRNTLSFIVDLSPEVIDEPLQGNLYLQADNLNVTDYLIKQLNVNAEIVDAVVGFEAWVDFSTEKVEKVQLQLNQSSLEWTQLKQDYNWGFNSGLIQLTNADNGWLLDSYDLEVTRNEKSLGKLAVSGQGDDKNMLLDFSGLMVKDILPFYLASSAQSPEQINALKAFALDASIDQFGLFKNSDDELTFSAQLSAFKNRPVGALPGVSNAKIALFGQAKEGHADIRLVGQKIYFDGQFSRPMPIKSGDISLRWSHAENGLTLSSEQTLLTTTELDTITEFSLFIPNKKTKDNGTFLSLYSYASLNDASKAQYYFPMKAMGKSVFGYLEPTIKKGHVKGAKILWYGAFNQYPYLQKNGVFQAWVPLRDAQYDFYGKWQGLTDLNVNLLFENDYLLMDAQNTTLGEVTIDKLSAKVDHLNPHGILTIKADISEDAQKISEYLKRSPLKESVGKALSVIAVEQPISGKLTLSIPFDQKHSKTQTKGEVWLKDNTLDITLADGLVMPLKEVDGYFSFINGDLTAKNISAQVFDQPLNISFKSFQDEDSYDVEADLQGTWKLANLSRYHTVLEPMKASGHLTWLGNVNFSHQYAGGYQYKVDLNSELIGIRTRLPEPLYKNSQHVWPTNIVVSGNDKRTALQLSIKDKLAFDGQLDYQEGKQSIPYFNLTLGQSHITGLDKTKQSININLATLDVAVWYEHWLSEKQGWQTAEHTVTPQEAEQSPLVTLDEVNVNIDSIDLFNQPLTAFKAHAVNSKELWKALVSSDELKTEIEFRAGTPVRFDLNIDAINFQGFDISQFKNSQLEVTGAQEEPSENLRVDYPEIFVECKSCIYNDIDLSPLSLHIYPTKKRLNIDYIKVGGDSEFTNISGFWDQRMTTIIIDTEGDIDTSLITRLGYTSPVYHQKAQASGALNWIGAPWQANVESLNGAFSVELSDGAITEVSDKGARLLSIFSLDGIRRSLNSEFDNVFSTGFNFDEMNLSGNIKDGVISNDDFYLDGSAGKIIGSGLVDLPNQDTNFQFSYSPDVTSSLPVLAAFAINPLTGAAVLMLTKILEPVVDTIIRVDFTVKGDISNPEVKLVTRQRGKIKLENSEVLQEMSEQQDQLKGPQNGLQ